MNIVAALRYLFELFSRVVAMFQQKHDEDMGATKQVARDEGEELANVARRQEIDHQVHDLSDADLASGLSKYTNDH